MAKRSRHRVEHEAQVEVKGVPKIGLVVDSYREAKNLEIAERDADEASLKLDFGNNVI